MLPGSPFLNATAFLTGIREFTIPRVCNHASLERAELFFFEVVIPL